MPSGKTHDRITLWCTPWIGLLTLILTAHWGCTFLVVTGFVFAGLMFGPDLDIRSVQSKRWGWLGWIWRPYRRSLRHRSWLSHGFITGTLVRLIYLFVWVLLGILLVLEFSNTAGQTHITWNDLGTSISDAFLSHWRLWLAIAIGIELGAMSHYIADSLTSAWKRAKRKPRSRQTTPSRQSNRSGK